MKRLHFSIRGRVQGVGFRYFCAREAERLHLTGYARNLTDGSVEVEAQGSTDALESLAEALSRGPRLSDVTEIEREERSVQPNEREFIVA